MKKLEASYSIGKLPLFPKKNEQLENQVAHFFTNYLFTPF
jgi:hypothetical protein